MLSSEEFDLWADGYEQAVGLSDQENSYPFAGYRQVLGSVYRSVRMQEGAKRVLDLGFGTGTLAQKLYQDGYEITGVDFSPRMIELAREKMPQARLICHDFSKGLPENLGRFDAIVSTYALHHLTDAEKPPMIRALLGLLNGGGKLYIGDVAFENRAALERCREQCAEAWDDEECYFVADEIENALVRKLTFRKYSFCAGVIIL